MVNKAGKDATTEVASSTEKPERKKTTALERAKNAHEKASDALTKAKEKAAAAKTKADETAEVVRVAQIQVDYTASHPLLAEERHRVSREVGATEGVVYDQGGDVPSGVVVEENTSDEPEAVLAAPVQEPEAVSQPFDFDLPGDPAPAAPTAPPFQFPGQENVTRV